MSPETVARVAELSARAAGGGEWTAALDAVTEAVDGVGATLEVIDITTGKHRFFASSCNLPKGSDQRYLAEFAAINPRLRPVARLSRGDAAVDHDFITEAEMDRDPFYADFLAPFDLRYCVCLVLAHKRGELRAVSLHRSVRSGPYRRAEIASLKRFGPAIAGGLDTALRLAAVRTLAGGLAAALDHLDEAVGLLDASGRLIHANRALEDLMRRPDGLTARAGKLAFADGSARAFYASALAAAAEGLPSEFAAARRDGSAPLSVATRPMPPSAFGDGGTIIFITDPAAALGGTSPIVLKAAFALSDAEIALAHALQAGVGPSAYAERRGLSPNTVYTHLRRLKDKTGTHRLPDLIARLDALRAPRR